MDYFRRIWQAVTGHTDVVYEPPTDMSETVTVKDMMRFLEKQSESNAQLMGAIASASLAQAETMKTYIDLFKPREVKSTTLEEREAAKEAAVKVRESEWEGIESPHVFNKLTESHGVPPEPGDGW